MDTAATGVGERRGDLGLDRAAASPDLTGVRAAFVTTPPCRPPHHMISDVGLIGEGHVPMPGDVSLAHHGVLSWDAGPECRRPVLEVLR